MLGRVEVERVKEVTWGVLLSSASFDLRLSLADLLVATAASGFPKFFEVEVLSPGGVVESTPKLAPEDLASGKVMCSRLGAVITSATRSVPRRQ
jgi:hypothetical protein